MGDAAGRLPLTFILAFSRESFYLRGPYSVALIAAVALVSYAQKEGPTLRLGWQVLFHAFALFTGAMVCHGELFRLRPAPRHLSAFYLWVSVGGVLGGVFVNLVAPRPLHRLLGAPAVAGRLLRGGAAG